MKLIIDIPDYKLDEVQNGSIASNEILKAVRKGTPISTEGDLISRSALKKYLEHESYTYPGDEEFGCGFNECLLQVFMAIDNAPTINTENCDDCPYCPKS